MNSSDFQQRSDDDELPPSKTQRKKDSHALQTLGEELAALGAERLRALALPEDLHAAIVELQRIRSHEGRRRHLQWIGKLMRAQNDTMIARMRADYDAAMRPSREDTARLHALEHCRERLLADDEAITQWINEHSGCEARALRDLVRAARKEQAQARAPRAFRELFQYLKQHEETASVDPLPQTEHE